MSADNYIVIVKGKDGTYRGYMVLASAFDDRFPTLAETLAEAETLHPLWEVSTIEEAIRNAQQEYTEYGYRFVNL